METTIKIDDIKLKEVLEFLNKLSFLMGTTHGSITAILGSPDSELRQKLKNLWNKLNAELGELYYPNPRLQQSPL